MQQLFKRIAQQERFWGNLPSAVRILSIAVRDCAANKVQRVYRMTLRDFGVACHLQALGTFVSYQRHYRITDFLQVPQVPPMTQVPTMTLCSLTPVVMILLKENRHRPRPALLPLRQIPAPIPPRAIPKLQQKILHHRQNFPRGHWLES